MQKLQPPAFHWSFEDAVSSLYIAQSIQQDSDEHLLLPLAAQCEHWTLNSVNCFFKAKTRVSANVLNRQNPYELAKQMMGIT